MSTRQANIESVPWDTALQIDEACDRYEAQYRAGNRPDIKAFLAEKTEPELSVLFGELLKLEIHLTSKSDSDATIVLADYRSRFPAFRAIVEEIIREFVTAPTPVKTNDAPKVDLDASKKRNEKRDVSSQSQELPLPFQLGAYELTAKLGRGGMGTVYRGVHKTMHRSVAVKLMQRERMRSPEAVLRFQREMRAVARLKHLNIVMAYDAGEVEGLHFLAMEELSGWDLASLVKCFQMLPIPVACECIREAARGLQHVYENGLVHRDIKPSNLMLTADGEVKLLDLGLARLREDEPEEQLTQDSSLMGTIEYMAPEQAQNPHGVDIRADLYSLGCALFKLITGFSPFEKPKRTQMQLLSAHIETPPPALRDFRSDVPLALEDLVNRLLRKDPADRPKTPADVVAALKPFASDRILKSFTVAVREICDADGHLPKDVPPGVVTDTQPWTPDSIDKVEVGDSEHPVVSNDERVPSTEELASQPPNSLRDAILTRTASQRLRFAALAIASVAGFGVAFQFLPSPQSSKLLDRIDPKTDVLVGSWTRDQGAWASPVAGPGCLRLTRPESSGYRLEFTVKMGKGSSRWTIVSTARPLFSITFKPEFLAANDDANSGKANDDVAPNWQGTWDYSNPSPQQIRITVRRDHLKLERDGEVIGEYTIPSDGKLTCPIPQTATTSLGIYLLTDESQIFVTEARWEPLDSE